MSFRTFMLWSHRWLGLTSGVLVLIAGLTGSLVMLPFAQPTRAWLLELHMNLLAGRAGAWLVVAVTVVSLLLQVGGVYLWWPPKSLRLRTDRGWWRFSYDFHNWVGVVGLLIMGLLGATALGRVFFRAVPVPLAIEFVPRVVSRLHTAGGFPLPLQAIYFVGSLGFVAQAITGALVWWRPSKARG
ncbi:MAG: PepSY domain-containing protein [Vicinamibacterales bacterium]